MDAKVSRKERRLQPGGPVETLVDNIFDFYPLFASDPRFDGAPGVAGMPEEEKQNLIMDIETLDGGLEERLDRAMFAAVKQCGMDPVEPSDGVQWAEAVLGEVIAPVIIQQVSQAVSREGPGVRVTPGTAANNGKENLLFKIELTGA
jgi:hypothetical protein